MFMLYDEDSNGKLDKQVRKAERAMADNGRSCRLGNGFDRQSNDECRRISRMGCVGIATRKLQ